MCYAPSLSVGPGSHLESRTADRINRFSSPAFGDFELLQRSMSGEGLPVTLGDLLQHLVIKGKVWPPFLTVAVSRLRGPLSRFGSSDFIPSCCNSQQDSVRLAGLHVLKHRLQFLSGIHLRVRVTQLHDDLPGRVILRSF